MYPTLLQSVRELLSTLVYQETRNLDPQNFERVMVGYGCFPAFQSNAAPSQRLGYF